MFQSDFGIIADYFAKRWKGYTTIENHKPIKHVDEMLKFMRIFAEDERFLQLDIKKNDKGEVTMCTILDTAINKGIAQGIAQWVAREIIILVQKKIKKNKPLAQIADEIEEEENMIQPIYQVVKDNPKATTEEIYQMINK